MKNKPRVLFLSHGGGPMPLLGDPAHQPMVECLTSIASDLEKPSAIIVVSAHWEERVATITASPRPPLIYDYYGFPQESYSLQYPCPGEPQLASQVHTLLQNAGIDSRLDTERGFDHGVFVPLTIMYPEADIPCIQLSLLDSLDPAAHVKMGQALQGLQGDNILVIGSGFSFHNMKAFFAAQTSDMKAMNEAFENWLLHTCCTTELSEDERTERLIHWTQAPSARFCHPREEHLLPLHFCYGVAGSKCSESFELQILNKKSSMYLW